uniref:Reverse transcriptase domain-containing protein n=1 Tax=Tanacetum cinerariifolium TaxID=118510 RepID=A0A6L2MAS3_TANCI|nr:reverse transcriptase domain-containing protein [Tanacetum cinerariifolium]
MTTLVEHMIVAGADNRPPMLEKKMYNSWQNCMLLYTKGKEHGRIMLNSIKHGLLVYGTIEVDGVTGTKTYKELTDAKKLQDDCDVKATNIILQEHLPIQETKQPFKMARLHSDKCRGDMVRVLLVWELRRPRNSAWFKEKILLVQAQEAGQVLDEVQLAFLADPGAAEREDTQTTIIHNVAFQTDDLDAFDSYCDEAPCAKAVFMANLSSYDSAVISEKELLLENDRLLELIICQDLVYTAVNSLKVIDESESLRKGYCEEYNRNLTLEAELSKMNKLSKNVQDFKITLQAKASSISKLRAHIATIKGKNMSDNNVHVNNAYVIALGMLKLDLEPFSIVEQARKQHPSDPYLDYACKFIIGVHELSQSKNDTKKNRITPAASSNKKNKVVEVYLRKVMSSSSKRNHVSLCNTNFKHDVKDANSTFVCSTFNGCLFSANHDKCVVTYINDVNKRVKSKSGKRKQMEWKPTGKVFTSVRHRWLPIGRTFIINGAKCPMTRITSNPIVPLHRRNRRVPLEQRNNPPQQPRVFYAPILDINYFYHLLDILRNYDPMDNEPMWAADRVVALTPGSAITILETANEFSIKGNHLTLVKGNQFDGSSNSDTSKIMAQMDAMTMKMDAQYKEFQSRLKLNPDHNDDNIHIFADKQSGRPSGSLPSNIQPNLKGISSKPYQPSQARNEHVNAVFTQSGKTYDPAVNPNDQPDNFETLISFDSNNEDEEPTPQPKPKEAKPVKETPMPKPYKLKISYPQRLRKELMEAQYGKFLDMIRVV